LELITKWVDAFSSEIGEQSSHARAVAESVIGPQRLFIWDTPTGPASIAAWARPTPNGVGINLVYTPPELRGNGYASNCVAALSQHLLDSGKRFCTLYTDLANPTSNKIYRNIGYKHVCDSKRIIFDGGPICST
jgi:predicted GNAT family acetyltransferase